MSSLMSRLPLSPRQWLAPGVALMLRLSMRAKLLTVAACVALPLLLLIVYWGWSAKAQLGALSDMRTGLELGDRLTALEFELHKHRLLEQRAATGDDGARGTKVEAQHALQLALRNAARAVGEAPRFGLSDDWQSVEKLVTPLAAASAEASADADDHDPAVEAIQAVQRLVAERSGLLLDPRAAGYFHLELRLLALPTAMASVARVGAAGMPLLRAGNRPITGPERIGLLFLARQLDHDMLQVADSLKSIERQGAARTGSHDAARDAVESLTSLVQDSFAREQPELPVAVLGSAAWQALVKLHDLHRDASTAMSASVTWHSRFVWQALLLTGAGLAAASAAAAYLFAALYFSFLKSIRALMRSTEAVAGGDLTNQVALGGCDELAKVGRTVNGMSETLSEMVGAIRSSAARVNMAGTQVADGSQRLSQRTEEQASSLRESVESINRLSSDVQHTAQEARELDSVTEQLSRQAGDGHQAMSETLAAVAKLQEASQRVFEVVAVIDDVAFQTSMLSLNAAVEAARAGEAGKGFSIVAGEVRQLAQRVGESADEIRALITQASDQLVFSNDKLGCADQALRSLVEGVGDVSERLRRISQASTTQSETLVSVAHRVGDLDQITRDNAKMVDESTAASQSLLERAQVLRRTVASMRLRQGSADEAHELLDRAHAHVLQVGTEQGLKDLHDPALGFIDRDLYVFALDRDGIYIACGAKPEMIGVAVDTLPGIKGTAFVSDVWAAAEAGGGWVHYEIANPLTGEVTPKESYVRQLDNGMLLGCGVYRRLEAVTASAKPRAAAWSKARENPVHEPS